MTVNGISICVPWRDIGSPERNRAKDFVVDHYANLGPVILGDSGHDEFNRSASRNAAADLAGTDVLVFADADAYVPLAQIDAAARMARSTKRLVKPFTEAGYLTEAATERLLTDGVLVEDWLNPPARGFVGLLWVMHREVFDTLVGFDENFVGYGGEDNAFCAAADNLIGPTDLIDGYGYSLWHPAERVTSQENLDRLNRYYVTTDWDAYHELRRSH